MPLSDNQRTQLDGIVQKMIANGESEDTIRLVIDDFKGKYATEAQRADISPSVLSPSLAIGASRAAVPAVRTALEEVATNPRVVPAARALARPVSNAIGSLGWVKGGPTVGTAIRETVRRGVPAAAQGVQSAAGHAASVLERLAPYAQTLSTLSGAQGVLDLAQMAEPNRRDIGVLGVGIGPARSAEDQAAHPALINMLLQKLLGR